MHIETSMVSVSKERGLHLNYVNEMQKHSSETQNKFLYSPQETF